MTESSQSPKLTDNQSEAETQAQPPRARSIPGRVVVGLFFGLIAVYFTAAAIGSMVTDLHGGIPQVAAKKDLWCKRSALGLSVDLQTRVRSEAVKGAGDGSRRLRWQERLKQAQSACPESHEELGALASRDAELQTAMDVLIKQ